MAPRRFGKNASNLITRIKSPRKYKMSVKDLVARSEGTRQLEYVLDVYYMSSKYGYGRSGRVTLNGVTLTVDDEGQRHHYPQLMAQNPHYDGRMFNCPAVMASCDCYSPETWISTPQGLRQVKDLYDPNWTPAKGYPCEILLNGRKYPSTPFYYKGIRTLYRVETESGHYVDVTGDQDMWVLDSVSAKITRRVENLKDRGGQNNSNAYLWNLTFKDGTTEIVEDMKAWAPAHGHNYTRIGDAARKGTSYKNIQKIVRHRPEVRPESAVTSDRQVEKTYKKIKARDLKYGDKLSINDHTTIRSLKYGQEYEDGYLMGLIVGDGSFFADGMPDLALHGSKRKAWKILKKHRVVKGRTHLKTAVKGIRILFHREEARNLLNSWGIRRGNKSLTKKIMKNREVLAGFITGLYDTDGTKVNEKGTEFVIHSTDVKMLKRLQIALNDFGCPQTKISIYAKKSKKPIYINGYKVRRNKSLYGVSVRGKSIDNFFEVFKPRNPDKSTYSFESLRRPMRETRVVSVRKLGKRDVYDITVDDPQHKFAGNGLVLQNCEDWKYRLEVAFWMRGLAEIKYSNGAYPLHTNPRLKIRPCIAKGQLVLTHRGEIPIEEVKKGDRVWTTNQWQTVLAAEKTGFKYTMGVMTESYRTVVCTRDHQFLVYDEKVGKFFWKEAKNLKLHEDLLVVYFPSHAEARSATIGKFKQASLGNHNKFDIFHPFNWLFNWAATTIYNMVTKHAYDSPPVAASPWHTPDPAEEPFEQPSNFTSLCQFEKVIQFTENTHTDVYDLQVENAENFTVNGVVVHNCKHLLRLGAVVITRKM